MRRCMAAASPGAGPNDLSPLFLCTNRGGRACGRRHARQPCMPRTCIWYHGTLGLPAASPPCHIGPAWSLQLKSESAATPAAPTVVWRDEGLSLRRRLDRLQAAHDHPGWARRQRPGTLRTDSCSPRASMKSRIAQAVEERSPLFVLRRLRLIGAHRRPAECLFRLGHGEHPPRRRFQHNKCRQWNWFHRGQRS